MNRNTTHNGDVRPPARIQDKQRRVNLKCKRKRNIIKKAIELRNMLDMDVFMIFFDRDTGKYSQYTSGNERSGRYTFEMVRAEVDAQIALGKKIRLFDDDDYAKLRIASPTEKAEDANEATLQTNNLKRRRIQKKQGQDVSDQASVNENILVT